MGGKSGKGEQEEKWKEEGKAEVGRARRRNKAEGGNKEEGEELE